MVFLHGKITNNLMQDFTNKLHPTKLVISRAALLNNVSVYRKQVSNTTKIMLMIKAFGYGSGDVALAKTLEENGAVDYFGVAYVNEGIDLREEGISLPIMVMNTGIIDLETILAFNLEVTIHSPEHLAQLINLNTQDIASVKVHIKIDTGMHRLGFHYEEIEAAATSLKELNISVVGVYTHLASSPDPEHDNFTREQFAYYDKCYSLLSDTLGYRPMRHVLNSAGIIRFPEHQYEMVRAGMGVYGIDPSGLEKENFHLICQFVTQISQINILNAGDTVGYVRRGKIDKDNSRIAVLPVGYADGYNRLFSNGAAEVYINGKRAPVIGNVCMDMTFINVTDIECEIGDEVELFGPNIDIQDLAKAAKTIDYEILTSIGARVEREYV
jgi:alanine racemase